MAALAGRAAQLEAARPAGCPSRELCRWAELPIAEDAADAEVGELADATRAHFLKAAAIVYDDEDLDGAPCRASRMKLMALPRLGQPEGLT
jgi:hypothetical protein